MKMIVCEDCKRRYDFDRDDFCPKCGAFNPPVKVWGTDSQGNVIRVDGVSEVNHEKSFVHSEVHREKRIRRTAGLDHQTPAKKAQPQSRRESSQKGKSQLLWVFLIIITTVIVTGNFILPFLVYLFSQLFF